MIVIIRKMLPLLILILLSFQGNVAFAIDVHRWGINPISVSNIEEFVNAIGSNRMISIKPGKYNLSDFPQNFKTKHVSVNMGEENTEIIIDGVEWFYLVLSTGVEFVSDKEIKAVIQVQNSKSVYIYSKNLVFDNEIKNSEDGVLLKSKDSSLILNGKKFDGTQTVQIKNPKEIFKDVSTTNWGYDVTSFMAEKGFIKGYADGTFKPNNKITREEFATIMVNALEINKQSSDFNNNVNINYVDVSPSSWSYKNIQTVSPYLNGYKIENKNYFKGQNMALRQDVAVALVKAMNLQNENYRVTTLQIFSDRKDISKELVSYLSIAVEKGIMKGYPAYGNEMNIMLKPYGELTRCEAVALIYNAIMIRKNQ